MGVGGGRLRPHGSPAKPSLNKPTLGILPSLRLPSQARAPTPHKGKVLTEDRSSRTRSRARALARARHSYWLHPQVPTPRSPLRRHKSQGALGRRLVPIVSAKARRHHRTLHTGSPRRPRGPDPLCHAPRALRTPPRSRFRIPPVQRYVNAVISLIPIIGVPRLTRRVIRSYRSGVATSPRDNTPLIFDREALRASAHSLRRST